MPKVQAELRDSTVRGWVLILQGEFNQLSLISPLLMGMPAPAIVITDSLTQTLGQWVPQRRCIELSTRLFREGSWAEIQGIFRHEVAHMAVSEAISSGGQKNESPHGPLFREICEQIEAPTAASITLTGRHGEKSAIMRKVEKLLALGTSTNPHEAEAAMIKARSLMERYQVSFTADGGEDEYAFMPLGGPWKRTPSHIWTIMNILSTFYFVHYLGCTRRIYMEINGEEKLEKWTVFEVFGRPENLEIAEYVFTFLLEQGQRCWNQYRKENRLRGNRKRRSYLEGFYAGVFRMLEEQRQRAVKRPDASSEALLPASNHFVDPGLEAFVARRHPEISFRSRRMRLDPHTMSDGQTAGGQVRINHGLRDTKTRNGELPG